MEKKKKNIKSCIKEKGLKIGFVAHQVGLSHQGFNNRLKKPENFTLKEAIIIAETLGENLNDLDFGIKL